MFPAFFLTLALSILATPIALDVDTGSTTTLSPRVDHSGRGTYFYVGGDPFAQHSLIHTPWLHSLAMVTVVNTIASAIPLLPFLRKYTMMVPTAVRSVIVMPLSDPHMFVLTRLLLSVDPHH